jgi:hypothetical protein
LQIERKRAAPGLIPPLIPPLKKLISETLANRTKAYETVAGKTAFHKKLISGHLMKLRRILPLIICRIMMLLHLERRYQLFPRVPSLLLLLLVRPIVTPGTQKLQFFNRNPRSIPMQSANVALSLAEAITTCYVRKSSWSYSNDAMASFLETAKYMSHSILSGQSVPQRMPINLTKEL